MGVAVLSKASTGAEKVKGLKLKNWECKLQITLKYWVLALLFSQMNIDIQFVNETE